VVDPVARQQLAAGGVLGAGRLAAAEGHPGGLLAQVGHVLPSAAALA
jgi:hypothetical protein